MYNLIINIYFSYILCICWSFIYFNDAWISTIVCLYCERMPLYFYGYTSSYHRYELPLRLSVSVFIPVAIISLMN